MMVAAPDCVRQDKIAEAVGPSMTAGAALSRAIHTWKSFTELTKTGVIGDARKATPEKGEKLLDTAASLIAERLIAGEPWN